MGRVLTASVLAAALSSTAAAQTPRSEPEALARAWTAIAAGRMPEAVTAADSILRSRPGDHAAIAVRIVALAEAQPLAALDSYERWARGVGTADLWLLEPIERALLSNERSGLKAGVEAEARKRLAAAGSTAMTPNAAGPQPASPAMGTPRQSGREQAEVLARVWTAVAQQRIPDALSATEQVLKENPRNHHAIAARIAALAEAQPMPALDSYDLWAASAAGDDPFLLEPIARAVLTQISQGPDAQLQILALQRLTRAAAPEAASRLKALAKSSTAAIAALAGQGDADARAALVATAGKLPPDRAAELLSAGGAAAVPALVELLKHPSPAVRADAVRSLGKIGSSDVIQHLRGALQDPHGLVSGAAALSLTRLRDPEGEDRASRMLESEVADVRLSAASAFAERGNGPWVAVVMPLLQDPNGLTRLTAAELVANIHPDAARNTLAAALADNNPVIRAEAIRTLEQPAMVEFVKADLGRIHGMLRDPDAAIRLYAAGAIVELTRVKA